MRPSGLQAKTDKERQRITCILLRAKIQWQEIDIINIYAPLRSLDISQWHKCLSGRYKAPNSISRTRKIKQKQKQKTYVYHTDITSFMKQVLPDTKHKINLSAIIVGELNTPLSLRDKLGKKNQQRSIIVEKNSSNEWA